MLRRFFCKIALTAVAACALLAPLASLALAANGNGAGLERVPVFVGFRQVPGAAEQALVRSHGGVIKYSYTLVPAIAASIPEPAIEALRRNPNVTIVEPDIEVYAVDAELDNSWGVKHIGAGIVHDGGNKGAGVKVAIIDSGIDYKHPDLDANYEGGKDFVNNDDDPMDDNGHGTHVAGTVAAEDNGAGVVGVAPGAFLYGLKVLGANGSGSYSAVIAALEWAVGNGIQVTNNSYGSSGDPGSTVKAAFDNAYSAGLLHVCAAGNSGNPAGKGDNVIYPARYASCIAVAATDSSDTRASFSSTGPDVELAAPGVAVRSTVPGGGYESWSGTSMACPHVAGVVALAIAASVGDVRTRLQQTADDLGAAGRDSWYGYGLVDADEIAGTPAPPPNTAPIVSITAPSDGATFDSGTSISFSGSASDSEDGDLTASLVWTSSLDGQIGTGGNFSKTLSDGTHTITASVTDSGGATGSASISITVGTPPAEPALYVAVTTNKAVYKLGETVYITVTVTDDGNAVAGAAVHCEILTASNRLYAGDATTNPYGEAKFQLKTKKPDGTGIYYVDAYASKSGYTSSDTVTITFTVNP